MRKILFIILATVLAFATSSHVKPKEAKQYTFIKMYDFTLNFTCSGKRYCKQMESCEEAYFYLNHCGLKRLDRDKDGIPCESICGH